LSGQLDGKLSVRLGGELEAAKRRVGEEREAELAEGGSLLLSVLVRVLIEVTDGLYRGENREAWSVSGRKVESGGKMEEGRGEK
jgi:hypothetical protein